MYAYRGDRSGDGTAYAIIATAGKPATVVNINDFDTSHGHAHKGLVRETANPLVTREGHGYHAKGVHL